MYKVLFTKLIMVFFVGMMSVPGFAKKQSQQWCSSLVTYPSQSLAIYSEPVGLFHGGDANRRNKSCGIRPSHHRVTLKSSSGVKARLYFSRDLSTLLAILAKVKKFNLARTKECKKNQWLKKSSIINIDAEGNAYEHIVRQSCKSTYDGQNEYRIKTNDGQRIYFTVPVSKKDQRPFIYFLISFQVPEVKENKKIKQKLKVVRRKPGARIETCGKKESAYTITEVRINLAGDSFEKKEEVGFCSKKKTANFYTIRLSHSMKPDELIRVLNKAFLDKP